MYKGLDTPEQHRQRSEYIRTLVQSPTETPAQSETHSHPIPRSIVQFWHDSQQIPRDVEECIDSWRDWTAQGFSHQVFDSQSAQAFIDEAFDSRYLRAFRRCYHPAMQADYFRLCYLHINGGLYVDADDVCVSNDVEFLFSDGRLKVQPLCYDVATQRMVDPKRFIFERAQSPDWIFYLNNNPLASHPRNKVIEQALERATDLLERSDASCLPEIQETTGPGNLSKVVYDMGASGQVDKDALMILATWETVAVSKWPLSYRDDARNWRLSNRKIFASSEPIA